MRILLIALAGCATATETPPDAQNNAAPHPDAATAIHDAPAGGGQHDAPVQNGSCANPFSGVLATWSFASATGSQATTVAASSATGLTAGAVARAATLTATSGAGSINSTGWATTATRDATKYYSFTLTPPSGCQLDLTSLAIDTKSSSTGPTSAAVATDADAFAASVAVTTSAATTPTLAVTNATGAVELRVYGFAASSGSGTMRLQNTLSISGSLH